MAVPPPDALVITGALTPDECREWIALGHRQGFVANGQVGPDGVQAVFAGERLRTSVVSKEMADRLWSRIRPHIPARYLDVSRHDHSFSGPYRNGVKSGDYDPVGVADLIRLSRYPPGGKFHTHVDSTYARDDAYVGLLTILVYLNDDYEGGQTTIYDRAGKEYVVRPEPGMAFVFYHHQLHSGRPVVSGDKYIARSEVVFALRQKTP